VRRACLLDVIEQKYGDKVLRAPNRLCATFAEPLSFADPGELTARDSGVKTKEALEKGMILIRISDLSHACPIYILL